MELIPVNDVIVVRRSAAVETVRGGIFIPETAQKQPQEGLVLRAGPGRRNANGDRVPLEITEGDTVLFAYNAGTEMIVGGEKVLILTEVDILGVRPEEHDDRRGAALMARL